MCQQGLDIRQSQCFSICEISKLKFCRVFLLDLGVSARTRVCWEGCDLRLPSLIYVMDLLMLMVLIR